MTIPDSPALDLDALTALEQAVPAAPWRVAESSPAWGIRTEGGWELVYASYADSGPQVLAFVAAVRNQLPALVSALAERSAWTAPTRCAQQDCELPASLCHRHEGDRVAALERELAAAREQAEQAQAVVAAAYKFADEMALFCSPHGVSYRYAEQLRAALNEAGAASTAAPKADEPFTTPCVAAELGVAHPAHVVSAKSNVRCAGTEPLPTAAPDPDDDEIVPHLERVNPADLVAIAAIGAMPSVPDLFLPFDDEANAAPATAGTDEQTTTRHGWTSHGYACCGLAVIGERPNARARCMGNPRCPKCSDEADAIHAAPVSAVPATDDTGHGNGGA